MNKLKKRSPNKYAQVAMLVLTAAKFGYDLYKGIKAKNEAEDNLKTQEDLLSQRRDDIENHDFRIQNPYEDIDVTTKAGELIKDQNAQTVADTLARLAPNVGGSGAAALATAVARSSQEAAQKRQAALEKVEIQLKQKAAGAQMAIDSSVNRSEYQRTGDMFNLQAMDTASAQAEANAANQQLQDAISSGVTSLTQAFGGEFGDVFKRKPNTSLDNIAPGQQFSSDLTYEMSPASLRNSSLVNTDALGKGVQQLANQNADAFYSRNNQLINPYANFYNNLATRRPVYTGEFAGVTVDPIESIYLNEQGEPLEY